MKLKAFLATGSLVATLALAPTLALSAEGGEASGGHPWLTLLFYIINFSGFIYIVKRYAGPAIIKFFHDRATSIRTNLAASESSFHKAEEVYNRAVAALERLESEKARLVGEIRDSTQHEVNRMKQMATETAKRMRQDAELTAHATAENGRRRIRARMAQAASAMAREMIAQSFSSADQDRLVDEFTRTLESRARP